MANVVYSTKWARNKREIEIARRGGKCQNEGCTVSIGLEFAHLKSTDVMGWGRGMAKRMVDVTNNPDAYVLLCSFCHELFDEYGHTIKIGVAEYTKQAED